MYQIQTPRKTAFRPTALAVACSAALLGGFTAAPVLAGDSLTEALIGGKPTVDMRVRYENVTQDNTLKDASALTVRTRLGYKTGDYQNINGFLEMSNVTPMLDEDYNSLTNGNTDYSVIADPTNTIVNRARIDYIGLPDTTLRYGRQRIIYDNARFIGNVGWRQTEQTFTAFRISNKSLSNTSLDYAYVSNRHKVTTAIEDITAHFLNASYNGWSFGKLAGYLYLLDFVDNPDTSTQTYGLRFKGATKGDVKFNYTLEYANQSDYADGLSTNDADYMRLEAGITFVGVNVTAGYEVLGSNDGLYGFSTPLATLHGQNGWADQFLATPADGLQDLTLKVAGKAAGIKLVGVYHDFSADNGGDSYGSELDLLAAKKFGKNYSLGVKYATYSADTGKVDTDKFWVWGGLKF